MKFENPLNHVSETRLAWWAGAASAGAAIGASAIFAVSSAPDFGYDCGPYRKEKAELKKIHPPLPSSGKAENSTKYKAEVNQTDNISSTGTCSSVNVRISPTEAETQNQRLLKGDTTILRLGDIMFSSDESRESKLKQ